MDRRGALDEAHRLTRSNCVPLLDTATRPAYLDAVCFSRRPQAEMQCERVLRVIASTAHHLVNHLPGSTAHDDASADGASVRLGASQLYVQRMPAWHAIFQQARRGIHVYQHNFRSPVAVQIACRHSSRWTPRLKGGSGNYRDIRKFA